MADAIVKQWLTELVDTAQQRNHIAHMNLISRRVSVIGAPGSDNIVYDDWSSHSVSI